MASIFKKLISKEFGENNYNKYYFVCLRNLQNKKNDRVEIYNDIFDHLKDLDRKTIAKMEVRLEEAMYSAVQLCRTYFICFLFYVSAMLYLLTKDITFEIILISITLMSISFLFKTYQFIINRYCFIDAQIVLVYKAVLERILCVEKKHFMD